jgi:hypothetical protein
VPEPGHSQHEPPPAPSKFYKPSARCAPDRTQADTKHETSSRLPCCWRRTYPSILERGSLSVDIACVHRDIPKDLTLSAEKRPHPLTPHLVVLAIEVWRTRTPFLVRHPWILDWLEATKTWTGSDTCHNRFSEGNQVQTYMHARIKFHAYSDI